MSDLHSESWGFESLIAHHILKESAMVELKPVKIEMTPEEERWLEEVRENMSVFLKKVEEAHICAGESKLIFK